MFHQRDANGIESSCAIVDSDEGGASIRDRLVWEVKSREETFVALLRLVRLSAIAVNDYHIMTQNENLGVVATNST